MGKVGDRGEVWIASAVVMDQFLCTRSCLSECRCYVDVNQVWCRVYVTAKRACYFGRWSDGNRAGGSVNRAGIGWSGSGERWTAAHGWYHLD